MSIPNGPSALAVKEAAWGLARYAAISQVRKPNHWNNFINFFDNIYNLIFVYICEE